MAGERCTGHCCRNFVLPIGPKELWERYRRTMSSLRGEAEEIRRDGATPVTTVQDIHLIAPMVTYLGHEVIIEDEVVQVTPAMDTPKHRYSCKHLVDGDCTIYEHRPGMCRDYPYSGGCNYAACTWESEKKGSTKFPILDTEPDAGSPDDPKGVVVLGDDPEKADDL